jgi:hypothetical protein
MACGDLSVPDRLVPPADVASCDHVSRRRTAQFLDVLPRDAGLFHRDTIRLHA